MYTAYFGLSEVPFSIAPDPAYLFMSERHREALAHLSYGLGDNGGFVLLTGEVGTGKTTISRSVMEKLPENTQSAFILNPTLSCEELLATICDSLKIRYKKTGATLKYLTDKIQTKLLKNHEDNINTLLIIDEAQHLKPEVLEQLRLLTNLETNTKKLLQVILIGQPELQQLLQRRDLRQLAQRITARYHLLPLTKEELALYIQHRLSVAHCTRALFNSAAITTIHRVSKGIPRVVNLLCDRALIIAYGKNDTVVNKKIVLQAAVEALGIDGEVQTIWLTTPFKATYTVALLMGSIFFGYWFGFQNQSVTSDKIKQLDIIQPKVSKIDKLTGHVDVNKEVTKADNILTNQKVTSVAKSNDIANTLSQITEREFDSQKPLVLGYQPESVANEQVMESFEIIATEGVSEDLLTRFKEAVNETKIDQSPMRQSTNTSTETALPAIHEMSSSIQNALPSLQFEMHMYATEGQGWVRVNGEDKHEGDEIAQGVLLVQILPQQVILGFKNEQFTMPALSNW